MAVEITRPGKMSLMMETPVMPSAGTFGYGDSYKNVVKFEKLGALVTNPVTYEPWSPASGTRVVPLDAGVLVHTGLPNPGLSRVVKQYRKVWDKFPAPVILHLVGTTPEHVSKACERLDKVEEVDAIELGLNDDIAEDDAVDLVESAVQNSDKPILVRLPLYDTHLLAEPVAEAGAGALVVSAPPRGTARDVHSGRLVSGRVYGPLVKPVVLRMVGVLKRRMPEMPIIGAGGIHSPQDARDFIEAGAVAVQVDSATWSQPKMLERISRDLGGWLVTRGTGALPDEWNPDMGDTQWKEIHEETETPEPRPSAQDKG